MLRRLMGTLAALALAVSLCLVGAAARAPRALAAEPYVEATVSGSPVSQALPSGFLGFSFEYRAMHVYTGRDPSHVNPTLLSLVRQLDPGQAPVLRIGGDSTDDTWWPMPGVIPPDGVSYDLTPNFLQVARALATDLKGKLIMGINLEADSPPLAAEEARAIVDGIGRSHLAGLEIGNEADVYSTITWYINRYGAAFFGRPADYSFPDFLSQFNEWESLMPSGVPIVGPALAEPAWMAALPGFLATEPRVKIVTYHRYPLRGCVTDKTSPVYASVANLLSDYSSEELAASVQPYAAESNARGLPFRLDELNSVACSGTNGVSDTFASALWVLDTLFNLAADGVDGVNLHTLPGAAYEPFTFAEHGRHWSADVRPVYYGMLMFARAFPPGAKLLGISIPSGTLKAYATATPGGPEHVVLINKDPANGTLVHLTLPTTAPLTEQVLAAPSVYSTSQVSLAGQYFPTNTGTGTLAGHLTESTVPSTAGYYTIPVPAGSAVMLTT